MLRYLLDTNIVIYVLKRRPVEVLSIFNSTNKHPSSLREWGVDLASV